MKKNIQALVLAAGTGSRLKPYTLNIPKCMVPINAMRNMACTTNQSIYSFLLIKFMENCPGI